jgi:predicted nuclease of predicted toxin-antitoxin system
MKRFSASPPPNRGCWSRFDKDFGELVIVRGLVHVGLIRLVGFRAREQGSAVVRLLATYEAELAAGAIITAQPWRVRVRPG